MILSMPSGPEFCCQLCGNFFVSPGGLTTHHQRTHQMEPWNRARYDEDDQDNSYMDEQVEEEVEDTSRSLVTFPEAGASPPGLPATSHVMTLIGILCFLLN
jgi:hypothetical protein